MNIRKRDRRTEMARLMINACNALRASEAGKTMTPQQILEVVITAPRRH
jgi:hypothetical protein